MTTLLIDDVDSQTYGFRYLRKEMRLPTFDTYGQEWLRNSYKPLIGDKQARYTPLTCYFLYQGTQNEFETMKSVFIEKLKECTLRFSDIEFYYDTLYDSEAEIGRVTSTVTEIGLNLYICSKYKTEVTETANRISNKTINVAGNLNTPAIVEITPSINIIDIVVAGLGESFTVKNLIAGQKVIINGEDCTVLQNGVNKFEDFDGWEFPKLVPGANTITFSQVNCDINIKYKPRYL